MFEINFAVIARGMSLFSKIFSNIFDRVGSRLTGRYEVTLSGGLLGFGMRIISENFLVIG